MTQENRPKSRFARYPYTTAFTIAFLIVLSIGIAGQVTRAVDTYHFNQKIGSDLTLAAQATTFNSEIYYLKATQADIINTFGADSLNSSYNSPVFLQHYYLMSVGASMAYINNLEHRVDIYNTTFTTMLHNSTAVLIYTDWVKNNTATINRLITGGGFNVQLKLTNAFIVAFGNPLSYWGIQILIISAPLFFGTIISGMFESDENHYGGDDGFSKLLVTACVVAGEALIIVAAFLVS